MAAVRNIKNAADRTKNKMQEGVDILIDFYEINENLKRFNEILNEVGGSL